jgi:hypothetical protein
LVSKIQTNTGSDFWNWFWNYDLGFSRVRTEKISDERKIFWKRKLEQGQPNVNQ